jgi:hypothetical protein
MTPAFAFVVADLEVGSLVFFLGAAPLVFKGAGLHPTSFPSFAERIIP